MERTALAYEGDAPQVRAARDDEVAAVAALLFESSPSLYEKYAGSRERAMRLLVAAVSRPGNSASLEVVTVADVDGAPGAGMAAFPVDQSLYRARRLLRLTLRKFPPWAWPPALRIYRMGSRHVPPPPADCYYVDSLATFPSARRRGAARALLAAAEERGRAYGLPTLALETELDNTGAQALYEGFGFAETNHSAPAGDLPGFISYVKPL